MLINTDKNQLFLYMIYELQNNESNAVICPKYIAAKLQPKRVKRFVKNCQYFYSVEEPHSTDNNLNKKSLNKSKNGRPKILTTKNKKDIVDWKKNGFSNRKIAKLLRVSESTIRKFLKSLE